MTDVPSGLTKIQIESEQYRRPVSESMLQAMGSSINGLLDFRTTQIATNGTVSGQISAIQTFDTYVTNKIPPVGSIISSVLSEAQFQAEMTAYNAGDWVLADGRNVAGSYYQTVTGQANIVDLRGVFLRGRDYTAGKNPDGDVPIGTYQDSDNKSHTHNKTQTDHVHPMGYCFDNTDEGTSFARSNPPGSAVQLNTGPSQANFVILATGIAESRPRNVTVNFFIRIN